MVILHDCKKGVSMPHILLPSVQMLFRVWVKGTLYSHFFFKFLKVFFKPQPLVVIKIMCWEK